MNPLATFCAVCLFTTTSGILDPLVSNLAMDARVTSEQAQENSDYARHTASAPLAPTPKPVAPAPSTNSYLPTQTSALRLWPTGYLQGVTPSRNLLPDAELVNSASAIGFDIPAFLATRRGYINQYRERLDDGTTLTGPQILARISRQYSLNPRVLLAMLEFHGGWINQPSPSQTDLTYPFGRGNGERPRSLYFQARWAAEQLNFGYYGRRMGTRTLVAVGENGNYRATPGQNLNAGTSGVQALLARTQPVNRWPIVMGEGTGSFMATYRAMYGDPWRYDRGQLVPDNLSQPAFSLPWAANESWYFTGGPHGGWDEGSPWSALDFATPFNVGCATATNWVLAMTDGVVARSEDGEVVISLDPTRDERIGWAVFYMHIAQKDRVAVGTVLRRGDRIGHPSCEGGYSTATHLHVARKYNGEWLSAVGRTPFVMDGWVPQETGWVFQGTLVKNGMLRRAVAARMIGYNSVP